jgi:predicted RND superfamily exporter protein
MTKNANTSKTAKLLAWAALAVFAGLGVFGAMSLDKLQTVYSVMQFLPTHHPALRMDQEVRAKFHIEDLPTFIGVVALDKSEQGSWFRGERMNKIDAATSKLKNLKGVANVVSLANVQGAVEVDGALSVGELMKLTPEKHWMERVLNDRLLTPNLVSHDGRTAMIYAQLESADAHLLVDFQRQFKTILKQTFPKADTSVGGVPAVQADLGLLLNKELINFLALTLLACAITLFAIFKTPSTVLIPLTLVGFCNLMVFALMAWTGLEFTVLSSTVPILVFIDVMSLSLHILLRVHEDSKVISYSSRWELVKHSCWKLALPNLLGSFTTCMGFLTLLHSDVPMIRSYGMAVSAGILFSSFFTNIGIMPLMMLFPLSEPREWVHRPARWSLGVILRRREAITVALIVSLGCAFIGRNLDWTGRLFDDLPKGQEARTTTERIDRLMGGVVPLQMVIRAPRGKDWVDPVRIAKLDKLVQDLRSMRGIGTAQSVPDFMRASGVTSKLPTKRAGVAELYFLYSMAESNPMKMYLTGDNRSVRIEMKLHDLPANVVQNLLARAQRHAQAAFPDSRVQIGGMGAIVHLIHHEISEELIFGFWEATAAIVLMLLFVFRSLRLALVACVPNLVPPMILLGYLAMTHTPIKPGVAIIFSIALGLAFTNTIYLINRMRSIRGKRLTLPVMRTFYVEANPCLVATFVVMMGFSVFMGSYFELNRTFGICMMVSILGGLLGDLILLPAMLSQWPWMLEAKIPWPRITIDFKPDRKTAVEAPKRRHLALVPASVEPTEAKDDSSKDSDDDNFRQAA